MGVNLFVESDDDEFFFCFLLLMVFMDILLFIQDDNQGNNFNEVIDFVKNMVLRESERMWFFFLDFIFQRFNVLFNFLLVKFKSFKKCFLFVVKLKFCKVVLLLGFGDRSFFDENIGEVKLLILFQFLINVIDSKYFCFLVNYRYFMIKQLFGNE